MAAPGTAMRHAGASATLSFRVGITDPHALRLGHFVGRWSSIEFSVEGVIWDLAGLPPEVGRVFTHRLGMRSKRDLIQGLLEVATTPREARTCWKRADDRIERLAPTVASLTHGHWLAGPRPDHGHVIGRPDLDRVGTSAASAAVTYTLQDLDARIAEVEDILGVLAELAGMLQG
jgi:hypothetical protein